MSRHSSRPVPRSSGTYEPHFDFDEAIPVNRYTSLSSMTYDDNEQDALVARYINDQIIDISFIGLHSFDAADWDNKSR